MTDDISKVVEARQIIDEFIQCANVGRWDGKLVNAAKDWLAATDRLESATTPAEVDGAALKARENLRQVVEASVAKSGSGAVLVSACTVADLFADYATLARQLAEAKAKYAVTLGVGNGSGSLFVHGDHDSIKAAQNFIFRAEQAESQLAEATRRLGEVEGFLAESLPVIEQFEKLCAALGLTKEPAK